MSKENTLPTLAELISGTNTGADELSKLLNSEPPKEWIVQREIETTEGTKTYEYLPIDKDEYLLREIFESYKIQIINQGVVFNGVWVTVRVHYLKKGSSEWLFHDGIGSLEVDARAAGAIRAAFPIAKTAAIKDACDHFGRLFGADLNRKGTLEFKPVDGIEKGKKRKKVLKDAAQRGEVKKMEVMP